MKTLKMKSLCLLLAGLSLLLSACGEKGDQSPRIEGTEALIQAQREENRVEERALELKGTLPEGAFAEGEIEQTETRILAQGMAALPQIQYKLKAKAFDLEKLSPYLAAGRTQKHRIGPVEYGFLPITTSEGQYMHPNTYLVADLQGFSKANQPLINQVKEALTAIGWNPAPEPHLLITARQAYQIYSAAFIPRPISLEEYLEEHHIPQGMEDSTYLCSIAQQVEGLPLYDRIENGNDDQHASLYALLWVDEQGKIIAGNISVPYEAEKSAPFGLRPSNVSVRLDFYSEFPAVSG